MSGTIATQARVAAPTTAASTPSRAAATTSPQASSSAQRVSEAVTSSDRPGLSPLPEGWKRPAPDMVYTPGQHQEMCRGNGWSEATCRDDWNYHRDQHETLSGRGDPSTYTAPHKPTVGERAQELSSSLRSVGMAGLIRANDALRRMGVVR